MRSRMRTIRTHKEARKQKGIVSLSQFDGIIVNTAIVNTTNKMDLWLGFTFIYLGLFRYRQIRIVTFVSQLNCLSNCCITNCVIDCKYNHWNVSLSIFLFCRIVRDWTPPLLQTHLSACVTILSRCLVSNKHTAGIDTCGTPIIFNNHENPWKPNKLPYLWNRNPMCHPISVPYLN